MNYEQMNNNKCYLYGTISSEPTFSHELYGENFYDTTLLVSRLSEQADLIPVTISDRLLTTYNLKVGDKIAVKGQFRSYNKQENNKSKLMLKMFVREIVEPQLYQTTNYIELSGFICKEPIYRTTPFKREICDVLIAVNRAYNKSDYLPCIAWGRNARFAKSIAVGEKVYIQGRVQSREYQKRLDDDTIETRTAYEISITKLSLESLAPQLQPDLYTQAEFKYQSENNFNVQSLKLQNAN